MRKQKAARLRRTKKEMTTQANMADVSPAVSVAFSAVNLAYLMNLADPLNLLILQFW